VCEPSATINTNINSTLNSKVVVKPFAIVHTNVKTAPNAHIVIKPYATINITINNGPDSQTFVNPYIIMKTIIKLDLKQPPPYPANPASKKIDFSKVMRSGRNVWKTNANFKGFGKADDDPNDLKDDDKDDDKDADKSKNQPATRVVGEARHGSCLGH
jgi:hypothetical protein